MRIHLVAVGRLKKSPYQEMIDEYSKRLTWPLTLSEVEARHQQNAAQKQQQEMELIEKQIPDQSYRILLDERGKLFSSHDFAQKIEHLMIQGQSSCCFMIGGSDGFTDGFRAKADFVLSLGKMVWPHKLARVMLLEQIYRAQQIIAGHPYHRD